MPLPGHKTGDMTCSKPPGADIALTDTVADRARHPPFPPLTSEALSHQTTSVSVEGNDVPVAATVSSLSPNLCDTVTINFSNSSAHPATCSSPW